MEGPQKKCPKCTHHLKVPVLKAKGHKQFCPYVTCGCQNCLNIDQSNYYRIKNQKSPMHCGMRSILLANYDYLRARIRKSCICNFFQPINGFFCKFLQLFNENYSKFLQLFQNVNRNFSKNFSQLFRILAYVVGGGSRRI